MERVVDCQSQHVPGMNKDAKATWLDDYRVCLFSKIQKMLLGADEWCFSQSLIDQAHDQITRLLTTEWLVSDVENPGGSFVPSGVNIHYMLTPILDELDERRKDLIRIRQIYIPELIIRLHFLLFDSRHFIPEYVSFPFFIPGSLSLFSSLLITFFRHRNLKRALQLANIVADSRYQLYEDFVNEDGKRLGDYLGAVREAILGGLEGGGSDPFRVIASA